MFMDMLVLLLVLVHDMVHMVFVLVLFLRPREIIAFLLMVALVLLLELLF